MGVTDMAITTETPPRGPGLKVGEAARSAGVKVQTLHFYEREKLVAPAARSDAGYRLYEAGQIERIRAIKRAQSLGFTLREIRSLMDIAECRTAPAEAMALAETKLAEIETKIRALETMRDALRHSLETCLCGGDLLRCDVLEGLGDADAPNPVPTSLTTQTGETR